MLFRKSWIISYAKAALPFGEDENEEGIVSLSPVNTEEELDMLLAHVLGDDGGGAND